jgi:hypothetical protein
VLYSIFSVLAEELGSSDESGKDWSDLEREAAEEDRERAQGGFQDDYSSRKGAPVGSKRNNSNDKYASSPKRSKHDKDKYASITFNKWMIKLVKLARN